MNHKFGLAQPISLILNKGHIGFWSRNPLTKEHFVSLDPIQATLLLQFTTGSRYPAQAAAAAGVAYDSNVDGLIEEFVRYQILIENPDVCDAPFYQFYHPDVDESEPLCIVEPQAFDATMVRSIVEGLRSSRLIGKNILSQGFAGTQGFGVRFRGAALARLIDWQPWTRTYFDRILNESVAQRFRCPKSGNVQRVNAFYFNALVIPSGTGTALHIDCTMDNRTPPSWVSVLYLETVGPPGGRLLLQKGSWPVGLVNPQPGMIVHFRGDLNHGVSDTQPSDRERSSLICEQYCLPEELLKQCPYFELTTTS